MSKEGAVSVSLNEVTMSRKIVKLPNYQFKSHSKMNYLEKPQPVSKRKRFKQNLNCLFHNITVEPCFLFYVISSELTVLAAQNLNLDKACRVSLEYSDTVCDSLIARESKEYSNEEVAVQQIIALLDVWKNIITTAIPCVLLFFLGAWSDRTGRRKICILLPMIGRLLVHLCNIMSVYFFEQVSVQAAALLDAIINALTGGYLLMYLGVFCYVTDITSEDSRTFRIGVAQMCITVGQASGAALSGISLRKMGYYGVFISSCLLDALNIWYAFVYVHDLKRTDTGNKKKGSIVSGIKSFFDINVIKDVYVFVFKKGPNKSRKNIILTLLCIFFYYVQIEGTILYLFTRCRLDWDALQFSFYSTCLYVTHTFGSFVLVTVGARCLQWHDAVLGLVSAGSKILGVAVTSCATTSLHMYIGAVIGTFTFASFIALRSTISKLCPSDELGKLMSIFTLVEMFSSLVMGSMYSWTYKETVAIDAGVVLYLNAVVTAITLLIFAWLYIQRGKGDGCNKEDNGVYNEETIDYNCSSNENACSIPMLSMEIKKVDT